jgi:hypothetical protein
MSGQPRQPNEGYDSGVSINQQAVISIMAQLQYAKDQTNRGEFTQALGTLDYAWALLPNSIRKKCGERPSGEYW